MMDWLGEVTTEEMEKLMDMPQGIDMAKLQGAIQRVRDLRAYAERAESTFAEWGKY